MARARAEYIISATDKTQQAFNSVKGGLGQVNSAFTSLMGVAAGFAGAAGIGAVVKAQSDAAKETLAWSNAIGVGTKTLTAMGYAVNTVGLSQEKLSDILKDTSEKIGDAYRNGGGEAVEVINSLGLSIDELVRMSPDQQLMAIAEQLDNVGTQAEKIQIMEALASDASLLLPLLDDNARGMRELMAEADRLGVSLDRSVLEQSAAVGRQLDSVNKIISTQLMLSVSSLSPMLIEMAQGFATAAAWAGKFFDKMRDVDQRSNLDALRESLDELLERRRALNNEENRLRRAGPSGKAIELKQLDEQINAINQRMLELQSQYGGLTIPIIPNVEMPDVGAGGIQGELNNFVNQFKTDEQVVDLFSAQISFLNEKFNAGEISAGRYTAEIQRLSAGLKGIGDDAAESIAGTESYVALIGEMEGIVRSTMTPLELFSDEITRLNAYFNAGLISVETYTEKIRQAQDALGDAGEQSALKWEDAWAGTFDRFAAGIGDAVSSAIMENKKFSDVMRDITRGIISQVISGLVEIGVKKVMLAAMGQSALMGEVAASTAAGAAVASAWAPAAAMTSLATLGGNAVPAAAAVSSTVALSSGLAAAGMAHDGISSVPADGTWYLQKGERVVSNEDSKKLDKVLNGGGGGDTYYITMAISAIDGASVRRVLSSPSAQPVIEKFAVGAVRKAQREKMIRPMV